MLLTTYSVLALCYKQTVKYVLQVRKQYSVKLSNADLSQT